MLIFLWKLIYRLSDDGFGFNLWRKKCEKISNVLVIIHTKKDYVFGGYTSKGWQQDAKSTNQYTEDHKAFMFSIRMSNDTSYKPVLANPRKPQQAININTQSVCIFGSSWYVDTNFL